MFRLPVHKNTEGLQKVYDRRIYQAFLNGDLITGLDACFVGVPIDWGASNRSGTRFGPRQIRSESVLVRACNTDTGAEPYKTLNVADCGDVSVTPYDLVKTCAQIEEQFKQLLVNDCVPLALGGDHTITYPILKAIKVFRFH